MGELQDEFRIRVRSAREELGLSQTEAAKLAGISPQSWRNYERGEQLVTGGTSVPITPTRRMVVGIARALGWRRSDALAWAGLTSSITDTDREVDQDVDTRPPGCHGAVVLLGGGVELATAPAAGGGAGVRRT